MPISGLIAVVMALVLVGLVAGRLLQVWWKYRGRRVVTCPESKLPVGVVVNAGRVAATSLAGAPHLRLSSCSRWPERAGCGQECLSQVEASPENCLVRNILVKWYAGKACALCGRPFGEISLGGAKPAVLRSSRISVEWSAIPAEQLQETLTAAEPICFACHLGNTMVREHPELVVDRTGAADRRNH
jgi:hypothetical protein